MKITKMFILRQIAIAKEKKAEFIKSRLFSKAAYQNKVIGDLNIQLNKLSYE